MMPVWLLPAGFPQMQVDITKKKEISQYTGEPPGRMDRAKEDTYYVYLRNANDVDMISVVDLHVRF